MRVWVLGWVLLAGILTVLLGVAPAAAQQPPPALIIEADQVVYDESTQFVEATGNARLRYRSIRVTADMITFDLQREVITARGSVLLVDPQGRELRGDVLTYDVRLQLAEVRRAETTIDRVHIRSEQAQARGRVVTAQGATLTTCPPDRPAYRITAREIEVHAGDRLIARRASLWLGSLRVFTLPILVISLRSPEATARSLPRIGYNNVDGLWVDYTFGYTLPGVEGGFYTKYGTRTGAIVRNTLTYARPPAALTLVVGRNQDRDMNTFDQAEATATLPEQRLGSTPVLVRASVAAGWFSESTTGVRTFRGVYAVAARTDPIPLASGTTAAASVSWRDARYGTGARQGVLEVSAGVARRLAPGQSLSLSYRLVEVSGGTPFSFDAVAVEDRVHRVDLQYVRTGGRRGGTTTLAASLTYDLRAAASLVTIGYGEHVADRYHWFLSGEYNLTTAVTRATADVGLAIGRGTSFRIQGIYHLGARVFEDLDYALTARLCDCFDLSILYRQVRREVWVTIGLAPGTQLQIQVGPSVP